MDQAGAPLHDALTVAQVGEDALIAAFAPLLPHSPAEIVGNGDDCAVLAAPDGRYVVSTDVLVEGHHFRTGWSSPEDIGARAAAQNLADAASMGARPVALVVSLVLPPTTTLGWVRGLARGLGQTCASCGAGVVGGDLSAGEQVVIAVTVHGDLEGREPVLRSGAQPGDLVIHVGTLGHSAAGLTLLQAGLRPADGKDRTPSGTRGGAGDSVMPGTMAHTVTRCQALFRAPEPPLWAGPVLAGAGASAMMDVSDSLLRDAGRLAHASGVVVDLDDPTAPGAALGPEVDALEPVAALLRDTDPARFLAVEGATADGDPGASNAPTATGGPGTDTGAAREMARTWVLTGGEDHGMLATVPAAAVGQLPEGARVIGRVRAGREGEAFGVTVSGRPAGTDLGWDHFRA